MNSKIQVFIKAMISSIVSAGVDLAIFYILSHNSDVFYVIVIATIIARIVSAFVNFVINKFWAFETGSSRTYEEIVLFSILFIAKIVISALLVWLLKDIGINQTILKGIIDVILFFVSYLIQSKYIFIKTNKIKE